MTLILTKLLGVICTASKTSLWNRWTELRFQWNWMISQLVCCKFQLRSWVQIKVQVKRLSCAPILLLRELHSLANLAQLARCFGIVVEDWCLALLLNISASQYCWILVFWHCCSIFMLIISFTFAGKKLMWKQHWRIGEALWKQLEFQELRGDNQSALKK